MVRRSDIDEKPTSPAAVLLAPPEQDAPVHVPAGPAIAAAAPLPQLYTFDEWWATTKRHRAEAAVIRPQLDTSLRLPAALWLKRTENL